MLSTLQPNILLRILSYLPLSSLLSILKTSKLFKLFASEKVKALKDEITGHWKAASESKDGSKHYFLSISKSSNRTKANFSLILQCIGGSGRKAGKLHYFIRWTGVVGEIQDTTFRLDCRKVALFTEDIIAPRARIASFEGSPSQGSQCSQNMLQYISLETKFTNLNKDLRLIESSKGMNWQKTPTAQVPRHFVDCLKEYDEEEYKGEVMEVSHSQIHED